MFVSCPVSAAVWAWFARVWARVQPGVELDVSSTRILLLGDGTAWQPPAALQQLWTYLRLLLLESIWVVRCASKGRAFSSSGVIQRFRAQLQQQLKQDWARSQGTSVSFGDTLVCFFFFFFQSGQVTYERSQATSIHPSKGPTRGWHNLASTTPWDQALPSPITWLCERHLAVRPAETGSRAQPRACKLCSSTLLLPPTTRTNPSPQSIWAQLCCLSTKCATEMAHRQ